MPSPDTDELATVPLPAGAPEAEDAAGAAGAPPARRERSTPPPAQREPAGKAVGAAGAPEARPVRQEPAGGAEGAAGEVEAWREPAGEAEALTEPQERVEPELIEADGSTDEPVAPAKAPGRWWRGFTGSLAAGLVVLALGVLVVAGICLYTGAPGPGAALLIGHPIAAVLALVAQRVADRRTGVAAAGAGFAVVLFTASALTIFWLT
ncbi:hypothetical protein M8542_27185 [Amycolatopsis sp. OK19-0408]|uniref:Uncharacterized protein n=1 Tax=Amycolatopsis iheyensis TaxID=2945988 RepID=A0A9X2SLR3_9PSEU|nr:hypothetical protein [Amycolatopsis iheyensis]MCR6486518.1 hypothetical protein [Amycolatopsis iheyensis]